MATNDTLPGKDANSANGKKSLGAHPENARIEAHKESARIRAHEDADDVVVPAVTADVDETPRFVKYGAAVLLGLAAGVACYIWIAGVPSDPQRPGRTISFSQDSTDDNLTLPSPFGQVTGDGDIVLLAAVPGSSVTSTSGADAKAQQITAATDQPMVVYLFEFDSCDVPESAALTSLAGKARERNLSLDVKGYTDEKGRAEYNRRLSGRRAKAVADYLVAHGVPVKNITVHAMGPTHAYASDAQDRRAEIAVVK